MHDVYHGKVPGYLADLCVRCGDTRLRSSSRGDCRPETGLRLAEKSFSVAAVHAYGIHCRLTSEHSYQEIHLVDT